VHGSAFMLVVRFISIKTAKRKESEEEKDG
jgi:hypothetical protein